MNNPLYRIEDLQFSYDPNHPLLDIESLQIPKGQILCFRGHNGSGKTTLLKLLCGLLKPQEGRILSEQPKAILVHQEPYLFQGTVFQNLEYPLRFNKIPVKDRNKRISQALELVHLAGFEKRKARELSGGEKKRIAIARALMTEPDVLLLDEPDANIDSRTSRELESLMGNLKNEGISLILSTHNSALGYRVSDRIIDLYHGRPVHHYENILRGQYSLQEGNHSLLDWQNQKVLCPSRNGSYSTAVISSKDVFLSKDRLIKEDYNQFQGRVQKIESFKEDRYILSVDCGMILYSQISSAALDVLRVKEGDSLFALFAPPAVHLY